MGESNRVSIARVVEGTWGTNPGTQLTEVPFIGGDGFRDNLNKGISAVIRNDRQKTGSVILSRAAAGRYDFELKYGAFDEFELKSVFQAAWVTSATDISADTTIAVDADGSASSSYALTSATATFDDKNYAVGQWVKLSGFATAANNGWKQITDIAEGVLGLASSTVMVDEAAGESVTLNAADYLRNGSTETSLFYERAHADLTQFFGFSGMVVNAMALNINANDFVKGSFEHMGKAVTLAQATHGTGTNAAANSNESITSGPNVGLMLIDGAAVDTALITAITLNMNNNTRQRNAVGSTYTVDLKYGTMDVTGNLNMYFLDNTYYDKFLADTAFSISWKMEDADGNAYIVDMQNCEFTDDPGPQAGGENQDLMENAAFRAFYDSTNGYTIQLSRLAAA